MTGTQLFTFGINHQTAPLAIRERVAFHAESVRQALLDLSRQRSVREAAILSTCNRTEVYCHTSEPESAIEWMAQYHRLQHPDIAPYLYRLSHDQAVKHAFRVASGLDSMVLGETQILGQIKQAVRTAEEAGTLGTHLHKLFQRTFSVAKAVRSSTDIGSSSVSMAAASVRLAERIFPSIAGLNVLFIGAGEMIELCATHFAAQHPRRITVANRTLERARHLAGRYNGIALTLNELPEVLAEQDIVVTSTASPLPILGKGIMERAIRARRHKPVFMVDLAVPRDIEAEVAELDDVFLYTVDDLAQVVQSGRDNRQTAVAQAEAIIESSVIHFMDWLESRHYVPTLRALRDQGERFRRHELERAQRLLAKGDDPALVIEALSHALTNKLLHAPCDALNRSTGAEREQLVDTLQRLYNLLADE